MRGGERISTHRYRPAARRAQAHYEQLQYEATLDGPVGEAARRMLADLGLSLMHKIEVRPARFERARWIVTAKT